MQLLFALLDGIQAADETFPPWAAGSAFFGVIFITLPLVGKLIDWLKVRELKNAEKHTFDEAKRQAQTHLDQVGQNFLPESVEAMIFRIERAQYEVQLRDTRWDLEEKQRENADLKSQLLAEQRISSELREELRELKRQYDSGRPTGRFKR